MYAGCDFLTSNQVEMKSYSIKKAITFFALLIAFYFSPKMLLGQFQRMFGDNLDNTFSKVIEDGSFYYVLGQDESVNGNPPNATVTRLDANGIHQWTLTLNMPSIWNDAVLTPSGDLLVVGGTLPGDATSQSLMGLVTPLLGGNFTWVRSYDVPGREGNSNIVRNPVPENSAFPYYVLGAQWDQTGGAIWDDIILMNIDEDGNFAWKKRYVSLNDDEFARDLEALPNGDMILAGNLGTQGVVFLANNSGTLMNGLTPGSLSFSFADVTPSSGGYYAVGGIFPSFTAYLMKYDNNLFNVWEATISDLTSVTNVWEESGSGKIYVTGRALYNGINRAVVMRFTDTGTGASLDWVKYPDNAESSYASGRSTYLLSNQIAFADGRMSTTAGFGQLDAFMQVTDLELTNCMTSEDVADVTPTVITYNGPELPAIEFYDFSSGVDILVAAPDWQQEAVCSEDTCTADFTFQIDCGVVTFSSQTNILNPSWQWTFLGGNPGSSTNQNPVISFPFCDVYDVCLTVTGNFAGGTCEVTICHQVNIIDNIPPVALCLGIGVQLDENCEAIITPDLIDGGSFDDCQIQSMSVSPSVLTGCGVFPVTLTVTDWCGNSSTCMTGVQTIENTPPTINCPANLTITAPNQAPCSVIVNNIQPSNVSVVCGPAIVNYDITGATVANGLNNASGTLFNQGVSTVTYTATDDCGNTTTCSFTVTVNCENPPSLFGCGMAVVTCFSGYTNPTDVCSGVNQNGPVMALVDIRDQSAAIQGTWWQQASQSEYADPSWTPQNMGQVFGIAIDPMDNVFVTASTIYACAQNVACAPPFNYNPFTTWGPGTVYRVDNLTGLPSPYIITGPYAPGTNKIPNSGSALGDIGYDADHDQFFVTNHADGMIYRVKNGLVMSRFNPFGTGSPVASGPGSDPSFVAFSDRIWGVAYYNQRVYFATWKEDIGRPNNNASNEIWSVGINSGTFDFQGTEVKEITIPAYPNTAFSNPVSDIAFSATGRMLLSERTMKTDCGGAFTNDFYGYAHSSRLLEYEYNTVTPGIWDLTPGHFNISSSNVNLKYHVGTNNNGTNSAGGCDYGYESFDPNIITQPECDRKTWCTGDLLMNHLNYPGNLCPQPGNAYTWLYGLQGLSATIGGTWNTSLLIDLDNNICSHDKILLGDVEILKCGCKGQPSVCDSINVTSAASPVMGDSCCFVLTLHNQKPNYFTGIQLCANNGVSISAVGSLNGWSISGYASQFISLVPPGPPGTPVQPGNYDFIKFCLSNYANVPNQQIIVKYYGPDETLVCMDTLMYNCSQKPKCLKVTDTVECADNGQYKMSFCIMSNALIGWNVNSIQLNPPPGITFTPSVFAVNNLAPGQMQCGFMTFISGAVDGQTICYSVTAHQEDITNPEIHPINCCTDTMMLGCVTMPACICNNISASAMPVELTGDTCCWKVTLTNNYSNSFFTGVQLDIITSGVVFGAIVNPFNSGWSSVSTSSQVVFKPKPPGSFIGASAMLPSFCLSGITSSLQVPQQIVLTWLGPNGITICKDTILLDCTPIVYVPCAAVVNWNVECDPSTPGFYNFSFQVTNNSASGSNPGFTANQIVIDGLIPPGSIQPSTVFNIPPLLPGQTSAVQTGFIVGLSANQTICFNITIQEIAAGSELNCCTNSQRYCFTMPMCSDSCCTDSLEFEALINQGFTVVNHGCSVTVTAPQFDSCYWFGTPPYLVGGFPVPDVITDPSGSWIFTFSNSGTYQICVTVFDGCQGKQMCTSVTVNCDEGCKCGTFSDMAFRFERGPGQPVTCGGPPVLLECPPAGYSYTLSGKFVCQGTDCPPDAPLNAQLEEPNGTITMISSQLASPYFGIPISNLYFQQSGVYTLTLTGQCGSQTCECVIRFLVDTPCTDVCPCDPDDIIDFTSRVERGFAMIQSENSCTVCFSPLALNDCETVEWYLNDPIGSPIGSSIGARSFCYEFPQAGDYNVVMEVSKKKDDGGNCDKKERRQAIALNCLNSPDCITSVFDNPGFSEGAVAGGLNSGGMSRGWNAITGEPEVIAGEPGSTDGWTMQLSGNLDTASVLSRLEPICLEKSTGNLRTKIKSTKSNTSDRIFPGTLKVFLGTGWGFPPVFNLNECDGINCFELASINLPTTDSAEWITIKVPYDLSGWDAFDDCGGATSVIVRPMIYVTNVLSNEQGGEDTYSFVQIDNFCFDGVIVAVEEPLKGKDFRIYPNPNTDEFTVELSEPAKQGMSIVIVSLTGQILFEKQAVTGNVMHTVESKDLAEGIYFLQIVSAGRVMSVDKFVKQ